MVDFQFTPVDRQRCIDRFGVDPEASYLRFKRELTGAPLALYASVAFMGGMGHDVDARLTSGQRDALAAMTVCATTHEASDLLGITYHAQRHRIRRALRALGARNMAHAVAIAYRSGELPL